MNRDSQNPRVPAVKIDQGINDPGVGIHFFFCFWLSVNSLSSPVYGYSEGWRPTANVGVHSGISAKASSTSSELPSLYSVFL